MLFSKSKNPEQTILLPQERASGAVRRRENAFAGARRAEAKLMAARAKRTAAFLLTPVSGEEAAAALFSIVRVEERRAANRAARAVAEADGKIGGELGTQTECISRSVSPTGMANSAEKQTPFARRHYEGRTASPRAERGEDGRGVRYGSSRGDASRVRGAELPEQSAETEADALDELISGLNALRGLNVRERGSRREE